MYTKLGTAQLKGGEKVEIGVVRGGDKQWLPRIKPFLEHKGGFWNWHIAEALRGRIKGLETRFYIMVLNGEIISNIMTVEANRAGILGHVYTAPNRRRQGAAGLLMKLQMADYKKRVPQGILSLGTGYDSHAYHLYKKHGFRGIEEGSGYMRYKPNSRLDRRWFGKGRVAFQKLAWGHWPQFDALGVHEHGDWLRSLRFSMFGRASWEGPFLQLHQECQQGRGKCAVMVKKGNGAVVGYASLFPNEQFGGGSYLLEFYAHPNFFRNLGTLLARISLPRAKVITYLSSDSKARIRAVKSAGWLREGHLKGILSGPGKSLDVLIYSRPPAT